MLCTFSQLDQRTIDRIRELEIELERPLIAYTCLPGEPAQLSEADLEKIRAAENQLGVTLVAVHSPA
jgi:hypothetical protein